MMGKGYILKSSLVGLILALLVYILWVQFTTLYLECSNLAWNFSFDVGTPTVLLQAGYRHFDCAPLYNNEKEIGSALKKLFEDGIVKREDLFITSKLWCNYHAPEDVPEAIDLTLEDLQLDYLDLYLIHWPYRLKKGGSPTPENFIPPNLPATWEAMEKLYASGKVRAIGVSNFSSKKLQDLLAVAHVPPAVNQVECHPGWQQTKLHAFCQSTGIHISAYAPLARSTEVLGHPIVNMVAEKLGKTPAQVILRWGIQSGHSVLPKSVNETRIMENIELFDWSIPDDLFAKFSEIEQVEEMPEAFPLEIQVKRITNTAGLMRNYILKSIDVSVSRPSLVTGEEHENNMRIGDDEEERDNSRLCQSGIPLTLNDSKQQRDSMEFCCASRKDDLAGAGSFIRKNKKYGKKIYSYEGRGFWQEEDVEYRRKQKQKERWQGEPFHLLKSRGQHLLTNPRVLDSIIRRAKVLPTDTVLEIGPGTGNLTVRLLELALKVIAVEIDERMVNTLQNRVAKLGLEDKLVVITGNVLKMELPHFDLCVSNIPYGISSPLIAKIFLRSFKSCFRSAILLLQKEFACRLLAKPGESDFNRSSLN